MKMKRMRRKKMKKRKRRRMMKKIKMQTPLMKAWVVTLSYVGSLSLVSHPRNPAQGRKPWTFWREPPTRCQMPSSGNSRIRAWVRLKSVFLPSSLPPFYLSQVTAFFSFFLRLGSKIDFLFILWMVHLGKSDQFFLQYVYI